MNKGKSKLFSSLLITLLALFAVNAYGIKKGNPKVILPSDQKDKSIRQKERRLNFSYAFNSPYPPSAAVPLVNNQFQIPNPTQLNAYGSIGAYMNPFSGGMPFQGFPMMLNQVMENKNENEIKNDDASNKNEIDDAQQNQNQNRLRSNVLPSPSPFGAMMPFYQFDPYLPDLGTLYGNPFLMNPFHSVNEGYSFLNMPLNALVLTRNGFAGGVQSNQNSGNIQIMSESSNGANLARQIVSQATVAQQSDLTKGENIEELAPSSNDLKTKIKDPILEAKMDDQKEIELSGSEKIKPKENSGQIANEGKNPRLERRLGIKKFNKIDISILGSEDLIGTIPDENEREEQSQKLKV